MASEGGVPHDVLNNGCGWHRVAKWLLYACRVAAPAMCMSGGVPHHVCVWRQQVCWPCCVRRQQVCWPCCVRRQEACWPCCEWQNSTGNSTSSDRRVHQRWLNFWLWTVILMLASQMLG